MHAERRRNGVGEMCAHCRARDSDSKVWGEDWRWYHRNCWAQHCFRAVGTVLSVPRDACDRVQIVKASAPYHSLLGSPAFRVGAPIFSQDLEYALGGN